MNLFKLEPALILGGLVAIVNALVSFNVISDDSKAALVALITALLPVVTAIITRQLVTPVAKLNGTTTTARL